MFDESLWSFRLKKCLINPAGVNKTRNFILMGERQCFRAAAADGSGSFNAIQSHRLSRDPKYAMISPAMMWARSTQPQKARGVSVVCEVICTMS